MTMTEQQLQQIKITGEPISTAQCRFVVDRPVYPGSSFFFGSKESAEGSPLAKRLFDIEGVSAVLISHDRVTVSKYARADWPVIGKQIGAAIRAHLATGESAVRDELRKELPPEDAIREKVQDVLDTEINPSVATHGGVVRLLGVKDNNVFIQMGGGCQGCGMADVTLKHGIEVAIRAAVPEVGDIMDTTDHGAGRNPYFTPSKK
jgi:Fe-S cluster biogenesis protein NfuA